MSINLPNGKINKPISTPLFVMSIALSKDEKHLYVMRGRNTDQDWITVLNTGVNKTNGELRPAYAARTLPAYSPGPGKDNRMLTVGGFDAQFMEDTAELLVIKSNNFSGFGGLNFRRYQLAAPDHYSYMEVDNQLYIGHLRKGFIQILDRDTGDEISRIQGCPILHGAAKDEATQRIFFSCAKDIQVIGTQGDEMNINVARISYPVNQRIGAFFPGKGRIMWAFTEGLQTLLYRIDPSQEPYKLDLLPVEPSLSFWASDDGEILFSLAKNGELQILNGENGQLIRRIKVSKPFTGDYHEDLVKAILPEITTFNGLAYISLPHEGRIAEVDYHQGVVVRYFNTGGKPTRLVVASVKEGVN